ncbi:MAG: methyltransferase domain-containing protein [Isosphaeraceae bacterium]|nr:methyltransferase domain-containing protein [Isosphaeraceae bacterium]
MIRQSIKDAYFQLVRYISLPSTWTARVRYGLFGPPRPEGFFVHLGCGFKYLDGLINVDGNVFRKIDLWQDLRNRLPFPNKSCKLVYSSHTLEHMFPYEAMGLLREVRRVLADDGVARIAVPSMEYALAIARGDRAEDWPRPFEDSVAQAVNYLFCDGQHKYAYNFNIIETFARQCGFSRVVNYSATHGVAPKSYGPVTVGDEPEGSLVVELSA